MLALKIWLLIVIFSEYSLKLKYLFAVSFLLKAFTAQEWRGEPLVYTFVCQYATVGEFHFHWLICILPPRTSCDGKWPRMHFLAFKVNPNSKRRWVCPLLLWKCKHFALLYTLLYTSVRTATECVLRLGIDHQWKKLLPSEWGRVPVNPQSVVFLNSWYAFVSQSWDTQSLSSAQFIVVYERCTL